MRDHLNGNLWRETPYKNGKFDGVAKVYYENGKLTTERPYRNDEIARYRKNV